MSQNNIIALLKDIEARDFLGCDSTETLDLNAIFKNGYTLLTRAIRHSDLASIEFVIQKGARVNQREEGGATPLLLAVFLNRLEVVKLLVENSASIHKGDSFNTPLSLAVRKQYLSIVEFLVEKGARINEADAEKKTPLFLAIEIGNLQMLKVIVKRGILNRIKNSSGESPLIFAIKIGSSREIIQCLLKKGADISKLTLAWLAEKGAVDVIRILIEHGADGNVIDEYGNTPLATAVRYQQFAVVKFLVNLGVNICKVGPKGKSPLLWAIVNQDLNMVNYLLNHGAAFMANTVFLDAIATKNLQIVQILYEAGADKNRVTTQTPLAKAIEVKSVKIVEYLLDNGANFIDDLANKETLHVISFIENKNYKMVKLLIERGASLEKFGSCGHTPLTKAIQKEDFQMVKFCVEQNANVNQPNRQNLTPLAVAAQVKDFRTFQYLVEAGATIEDDPMKLDNQMLHYYNLAREQIARKKQERKNLASNQEDADQSTEEVVDPCNETTTITPENEKIDVSQVGIKHGKIEEVLEWSRRFYRENGLKEKVEKGLSSLFQPPYFFYTVMFFILLTYYFVKMLVHWN